MWQAFQYRRFSAVVLAVAAGYAWLGYRLHDIQVARHVELQSKAREYTDVDHSLLAWRGQIRDRQGRVLAVSAPVGTVYLDGDLSAKHPERVARVCGSLLGLPPQELAGRLASAKAPAGTRATAGSKAILLRRNVPAVEWEAIRAALAQETFGLDESRLTGAEKAELSRLRRRLLFYRETHLRAYPYGDCLSRLLGFASVQTNRAGLKGVCGLERSLDPVLRGEPGRIVSERDAAGNELPQRRSLWVAPRDGSHVVLTVDLRVQEILERALAAGLVEADAGRASALVMDPRTFEVLGLACLPGFDPNHPGDGKDGSWRNPVFSDQVEPGSTFKLITLAAALDLGVMRLDRQIYCERGRYRVGGATIHDHVPYEWLSLRDCFAKSSNIGFAKVAEELGPERFYRYIRAFGFGQRSGAPFLGETAGTIAAPQDWSLMELTRIAFGQGLSVSQFQLTLATCVVANQGRALPPRLVRHIESPHGQIIWQPPAVAARPVLKPETARQLAEAMKAVIARGGTGAGAAMSHYTLAGKTGTAQKANRFGYIPGAYYSSMIGFFPADRPQVVISVALDEPKNGYFAGTVVAPVFRSVAQQVAEALGIVSDPASGSIPALASLSPP